MVGSTSPTCSFPFVGQPEVSQKRASRRSELDFRFSRITLLPSRLLDHVIESSAEDLVSAQFVIRRDLEHAGLWQMQVIYRDSPITSSPIRGSYFQAGGHGAVSPNLDSTNLPTFTATRVEAPSARIQVLDLTGNPLHVTVHLGSGSWNESFSATTDDHGEVLFTGLLANVKYYVSLASAPGTEVQNVDLGKFLVRPAGRPVVKGVTLPVGSDPQMLPSELLYAEPGIMEKIFVAEANTETRVINDQPPRKCNEAGPAAFDHAGPMQALWPHEWITDGAGSVYIPTVEAGEHTFHVVGESKPVRFKVSPLPSPVIVVHLIKKQNLKPGKREDHRRHFSIQALRQGLSVGKIHPRSSGKEMFLNV